MKKHRSDKKSADKPAGKTLTVLNIPPYSTEESIARVFAVAGEVANVQLVTSYSNDYNSKYQVPSKFFNDTRPFKFLIGFVAYKKSESLDLILRVDELPPLNSETQPVVTGIAKWTEEYNKRSVDTAEMQNEIDEYMQHYDKAKRTLEKQEGEGDDGWVTVGKRGHNAGFKQKQSVINRLEQKIENQKKKAKSLTSFYSFELRDSKKQQLMDLRKKFENDKTKMNLMRQNRKFKPYQ